MFRVGVLRFALKRGRFIEFDAKQFYGSTEQHFRSGNSAMIVDDFHAIVADIFLEEAPRIEIQAKEIGYTVETVEINDDRVRYKFTLPPLN